MQRTQLLRFSVHLYDSKTLYILLGQALPVGLQPVLHALAY